MYAAFMLVGALLITIGALGSSFQGRPTTASAAGAPVEDSLDLSIESSAFASKSRPALPLQSDVLAEQSGTARQLVGQTLQAPMEPVVPAPTPPPASAEPRSVITGVNLTFYDCADQGFCGAMYNGRQVYEGAAACSWDLAIGTEFVIVGDPTHRVYVCEDRGLLPDTWIDVFWYHPSDGYAWQAQVGRYGTIEIVSTP